jgi:hypothetical protein
MRPVLINGVAGIVAFLHGQPFSIGTVTARNGRIVELDFLADPERVGCINSISCCGGFVFVDESAEQVLASDRGR